MTTNADRKQVALAFHVGLAHLRPMVAGILEYARDHASWTFLTVPEPPGLSVAALERWSGDGVICTFDTPAEIEAAARLRVPMVTSSRAPVLPHVPRIRVDDEAVGRLGATHLLECGFKRFAFYGIAETRYSRRRGEAFARAVAPHPCSIFDAPHRTEFILPGADEAAQLADWLRDLKPPVGLLAANDYRASMVLEACRGIGRRVPDDISIVGVDDNAAICQFSQPTLTSIACDRWRIGYTAAGVLDRLMHGEAPRREVILIPPLELRKRGSTDIGVFEDPYLTRAHRYVREHIAEPFGAERLVEVLGVTRRCIEQHFRRSADCTPYEFVCRMRVDRAREILDGADTEKKIRLGDVARACGFHDLRRFRVIFARHLGITPAQYRKQIATNGQRPGTTGGGLEDERS